MKLDADGIISSISLPDGHTVLGHCYESEHDLTIILVSASDANFGDEQVYIIVTCILCSCQIIVAEDFWPLSLNTAVGYLSQFSPALETLGMIRQVVLMKKFGPDLYMTSLLKILLNYGTLELTSVSTYKDITR